MTLTEAAAGVLSATETGRLDAVDQPILELNRTIRESSDLHHAPVALNTIQQARNAISAHRAHIADCLRELDRSVLYSGDSGPAPTSWDISA